MTLSQLSLLLAVPEPPASTLDQIKTGVDIFQGLATAFALAIGGLWTYFRFVKERTYRPRLEVSASGQWVTFGAERRLHVRIAVKNIGATQVTLLQHGTGVRVSRLEERATVGSREGAVAENADVFDSRAACLD